ncbi:MAG TPA: hypothetical protein VG146_08325 [Verrucomicrobiae bacterium]|nr:hypothetical protein [Verrucomicrobiae bacterium]
MKGAALLLWLIVFGATARAQSWLDVLQDSLSLKSPNGFFQSDLTGLLDLEGYYVDQRPPGLLFENESFFNPRLSLFLDTSLGPHLYSFVQVRLDRGFDPGEKDFDARADEYLLRWTPGSDSRISFQFGKFATVVGSWVKRHDSWQNPLITAPLPYENITTISDEYPPVSPADFLARRHLPDMKDEWIPAIWGPVYATGWGLLGVVGKIDYAFDIKNASISSHPYSWELGDSLWQYPTLSGRLGFRPNPAWNQGMSFSIGPYLSPEAADALPPGKGIGDYNQFTFGYDLSYAHHHWEWWGEVFLTRFEVPNIGNADLLAYYLELKYKINSGLYAAARWNQELYGTVNNGAGGQEPWDNDMLRIDLALGYRFNRHLQSKVQYSFGHRNTSLQQGEQLLAAQVTLKF